MNANGDGPFPRRMWVGAIAIAMALIVGALDYVTGSEASVSLLYLVPIAASTWFLGLRAGLLLCGLSAVVRLQDMWLGSQHFSHPLTLYWNGAIELGFFLVVAGILSKLRSTTEREAVLVKSDPLTGALNRAAFIEAGTREITRAERYDLSLSIAYVDVDDLKKVNEEAGQEAGDRLLAEIAAILRRNLRSSDLVARYGGDEIVCLLPETNEQAARAVLDKLMAAMRGVINDRWSATVSVGAVSIDGPRTSLDRLIHQADNLVLAARQDGGDCVQHRHLYRGGTSDAPSHDGLPLSHRTEAHLHMPAVAPLSSERARATDRRHPPRR